MIRRFQIFGVVSLITLMLTAPAGADEKESGFKPIFNGKDLSGWSGKADFWSVKDGAITGQTTKDKPTSGNTFIIWKDGLLGDFELRMKFRIVGGNSGIQFRSREVKEGSWVIAGYQADFDAGNGWTGTLYEEKGRGILAKRGSAVTIAEDGKKQKTGDTTPEQEIKGSVTKEDWNDYRIVAKGNHLQLFVNGKLTVDVTDNQESKRAMKGQLALQLHAGPPMTVQFKDVQLKDLSN